MSGHRAETRADLRKIIEIIDQRIYELKPQSERLRFTNLWALLLLTAVKGAAAGASILTI